MCAQERRADPGGPASPDRRWRVEIVDNNVVLRSADDASAPATTLPLTTDGTAERPYVGPAVWSPDSSAFVLTRVARVPVRQITIVESAPGDQLQPKTRQVDYIKPGDPLPDVARLYGRRGNESVTVLARLTAAGEELRPWVKLMGVWGQRWVRREVTPEDADPALLMWDVRRNIDLEQLPERRVVVHFNFRGAPKGKRSWWLILDSGMGSPSPGSSCRRASSARASTPCSPTSTWSARCCRPACRPNRARCRIGESSA